MESGTRRTVLIALGVLLVALLGVWWYSGFSLEFTKFFAAEPEASPVTSQSSSVQCAPGTQTIAVGQSATVTAQGGQTPYRWFAPGGTPATGSGASVTVSYDEPGIKKVTVEAERTGSSAVDSRACTITVTP